jgi:hypothetical protein
MLTAILDGDGVSIMVVGIVCRKAC